MQLEGRRSVAWHVSALVVVFILERILEGDYLKPYGSKIFTADLFWMSCIFILAQVLYGPIERLSKQKIAAPTYTVLSAMGLATVGILVHAIATGVKFTW